MKRFMFVVELLLFGACAFGIGYTQSKIEDTRMLKQIQRDCGTQTEALR